MDVAKGLKPAIAAFNHSEKNLINQVAERVKENGFPLYAVTQVYLKNESTTNENITGVTPLFLELILRFISLQNKGQPQLKSIRAGKTQLLFIILMVVLTFLNRKKNVDVLALILYELPDNYNSERPIDDPSKIVANIHEVLFLRE